MKKAIIIFLIFFLFSFKIVAQLTTNTTLTPTQLVQDVLLGQGVTAFNVSFTGANSSAFKAIGQFNVGPTNNLGFNAGVVITTGIVNGNSGPSGPNNSDGAGVDNYEPGDVYLSSIAGAETANAAVV